MARIEGHPILQRTWGDSFTFTFSGRPVQAYPGDVLASALVAAGVHVLGHHAKDRAPLGIFCANGQCAQCLVLADGKPVKACMTLAEPGMRVEPIVGLPHLPESDEARPMSEVERREVSVLVLGGGPAGLSAGIELGRRGVDVLLLDDKSRLGGKLVLQTHRFFGSVEAVDAGTRGIDIGASLEASIRTLETVTVWLEATALAVYSDGWVGILRQGRYELVRPRLLIAATGAREKSLAFSGNTLPGVYGAGAFQTLVNRDLVRPSERLFVVGGGNVGLIAGYHALQAGIEVVGLAEALPVCGGYKVHRDKLARLGVPIFTSHTILSANGDGRVESVTLAAVDEQLRPIVGTEFSLACDTVLVAVGLEPVDEFLRAANEFGLPVLAAGDAEEIAEASAAIFSGKIRGLEAARRLGVTEDEIPEEWHALGEILKSRPGATMPKHPAETRTGVVPVIHCTQEIPCNPCASVCPQKLIQLEGPDIRGVPAYSARDGRECVGCENCVAVCPGLAITLVDFRRDPAMPTVTVPFEFGADALRPGSAVVLVDTTGEELGEARVEKIAVRDRTALVKVKAPADVAGQVAGIRVRRAAANARLAEVVEALSDETIICRCERVTAGEIRAAIRAGCRDMNELKAITRAGMGACGGKTCTSLIARLFREAGVALESVTPNVRRPLFVEVPLGVFAGLREGE
ncbi:MAG: 2Fe-2S iron-sulfur cluster-binding protein [Candidatus Bipolaricaulota bacterium]